MKATILAFLISLAFLLAPETGMCAQRDSKIVTRIETVTARMKGSKLVVQVMGMARTPALIGGGHGQLLPHKGSRQLNKDGLLEYDLFYNAPANYSGDKLKSVKATLKESSVPADIKGVRIYGEFNEMNGMLPEPKKKKSKRES